MKLLGPVYTEVRTHFAVICLRAVYWGNEEGGEVANMTLTIPQYHGFLTEYYSYTSSQTENLTVYTQVDLN